MKAKTYIQAITAFWLLILSFCSPSIAEEGRLSILLDAETQDFMELLARPLYKQANLNFTTNTLHVINSNEINAFVAPGNDIFFYTGLIAKSEEPNEIRSVIAHEIGHIKGRHISKSIHNQSNLTLPAIIGGVLGVGALATGAGDAGIALIMGGQAAAGTGYLKYSRSQERQADSYGLRLLNESGYSGKSMMSFFEKIRGEQLLYTNTPPAYLLTHPMPSERLDYVRHKLESEGNLIEPDTSVEKETLKRIQAKIFALTNNPGLTLRKYTDLTQEPDIYARSIAFALQGKTDNAIELAKILLHDYGENPYYNSYVAELLLDKSEYGEAAIYMKEALKKKGGSPLLHYQYAQILMLMKLYEEALSHYLHAKEALQIWPGYYRDLGIVYGKLDRLTASHLALAESAALKGDLPQVKRHIQIAESHISNASNQEKRWLEDAKRHLLEQLPANN